MRRFILIGGALASANVGYSQTPPPPAAAQPAPVAAATVNGEAIPLAEVDAFLKAKFPVTPLTAAQTRQMRVEVDRLPDRELTTPQAPDELHALEVVAGQLEVADTLRAGRTHGRPPEGTFGWVFGGAGRCVSGVRAARIGPRQVTIEDVFDSLQDESAIQSSDLIHLSRPSHGRASRSANTMRMWS